jgi:FAD/FMN-containing dehydrogenase
MFHIDDISHLVTVDADWKIAKIERELDLRGFTLGYFSPPRNDLLLEEALRGRAPNLYAALYGDLAEICVAVEFEGRGGLPVRTKVVPRQATGPNWKNFLLGTGRRLGLIYRATLRIHPKPRAIAFSRVGFASPEDSYALERAMERIELKPRAFGRFPGSEIILILEWAAGSDGEIRAIRSAFQDLLGSRPSEWMESDSPDSSVLSRSLRRLIPSVPWGGIARIRSDENALALEKEILEAL